MAKILLVYGSTTGNTESVATLIDEILKEKGLDVTMKDVIDANVSELSGYDAVLLGSSTWGDEEKELQEDFVFFYEDMDGIELDNQKIGIFGCGESSYEHFCGAVDLLEERVEEKGGKLLNESLRIDGDPGDVLDEISDWATEIAVAVVS